MSESNFDDEPLDALDIDAVYRGIVDPSAYEEAAEVIERLLLRRPDDLPPENLSRLRSWQELQAHFKRAEQLFEHTVPKSYFDLARQIEAQPCAAMVVAADGGIVGANAAARLSFPGCEDANVLELPLPAQAERGIRTFLRRVAGSPGRVASEIVGAWHPTSDRAIVMVLEQIEGTGQAGRGADDPAPLVLVRTTETRLDDRLWGLVGTAFALTQAESEILRLLGEGLTIRAIAERQQRSLNTVRTHVKAIFDKTGTRSQGELGRVITAVAYIAPELPPAPALAGAGDEVRHRALTLPDGRVQAYVETGPEAGHPVLFIQPSTRPDFAPQTVAAFRRAGLRVISPVRPGSWGMPRPKRPWGPEEGARDYAALPVGLGIRDVVLAAHRTGGPYALRLALLRPDLFRAVVLVDTGAPLDCIDKIIAMAPWPRLLFLAAKLMPRLLLLPYRYGAADFHRGPEHERRAVEFYHRDSPVDQLLIRQEEFYTISRNNLAYYFENSDQLGRDIASWAEDWTDLAERALSATPLRMVHSGENRWFSPADVVAFGARLGVPVRIVKGAANLLLYTHPGAVADELRIAATS